jgi:hypothetical protein
VVTPFCFFEYALGEGRFLYLEDLFINEEYRKNGGGVHVMHIFGKDLPFTTVQ